MKLGHRRVCPSLPEDQIQQLTRFQKLQREIATARGHPTNAALGQSVICCCSVSGQPNCAIRVTNGVP